MSIYQETYAVTVPDLTACEREPIHIPSAIEPNGVLLVVKEPDLALIQTSSNVRSLLGVDPESVLEMRLGDLFSPEAVGKLVLSASGDTRRRYIQGLAPVSGGALLDALVHRHQGLLIVELEPCSLPASRAEGSGEHDVYEALTDAMAELESSPSLVSLCERIASRVRQLTGFDRVMVYRFLEDDSGSVVAEDKRADLAPYLGLRYPASDIPAQARRLYLLNTLRLKADVSAQTATLTPTVNPLTGAPLDMTYCVLRSMSPVHVEYLRNMGVGASLSISIVQDGRLWGLIACHHMDARLLPHPVRITCEVLARVFSSHIAGAEERDARVHANALRDLASAIEANLRERRDVVDTLTTSADALLGLLGAQGCILNIRGKMALFGVTPAATDAEALLAWLANHQREHVLATDQMAKLHPDAPGLGDAFTGMLSVRVALGGPDFLVWLRPSIVQVTTWAGNPDKPVEQTEVGLRISPRLSFEQWQQTSRDRSAPWDMSDREFAASLRPLIAEALFLQMNEEIVRLNLELVRSNVELDLFAHTASHDLQEPVRIVSVYSQMLNRSVGPNMPSDARALLTTIENAAQRMANLIQALLNYSQLGGKQATEGTTTALQDALTTVRSTLAEHVRESTATITHDPLPVVAADPNHMAQLLQNLLGNAIKYRRPDMPPRVHISSRREHNSFLLSVEDNGQGFDPKFAESIFVPFKRLHGREIPGTGIGLATCKRIVEIYNGRIWATSAGPNTGATVWFTLPGGPAMNTATTGNASASLPQGDPSFDLFARLRAETAVIHQQTEARVPVFEPDFDLAAYVRLLERFYGFWVPLEAQLVKIPALHHADLDLAGRLKTALLTEDLRVLGCDPAAVARCDRLPLIETLPRALGCLYVLEGSSLGARFISRRLEEHLQLNSTNGASFFNAYGESTGQRWSQFKAFVIPRVVAADAEEAIESAGETFQCLYDWLGA